MFFTEQKLKSRITELEPYRYLNRTKIEGWKVKEDDSKEEKYPPQVDDTWDSFQVGDRWQGRDSYLWLITDFQVPSFADTEDFLFLFNFGQTGGGGNSGFEALLFINDQPYQGVDSNHPEVFLNPKYSGQNISLALRLWSGLEGGGHKKIMEHRFMYADHALLSPEIDNLYYTSTVMLDAVMHLDKNDPNRFTLLNILEETAGKIDWATVPREVDTCLTPACGKPGDQPSPEVKPPSSTEFSPLDFYNSLLEANHFLTTALLSLPKHSPVTITTIGHTHIDVAWLWRLKHTREKCARSFTTVLRLMERYPEYYFLQTQPQLYAYIKEDYPLIYENIKEKIKEGSWEVDGGMWVEADCNLSSGESLVRQILHGSKFIKEEFNQEVSYLWLPDVFGYSWALPQILKKSGLETFMTTKISWNQYNRLPHDTFIWRGIDGSEVLTHFITTPDPYADLENLSFFYTYNGTLEPHTVKGIYDGYRNKDFNSELLLSYGYGDGGGGVTREMLEKRRRLDQMPGLPHVKTGRAGEYFKRLHETVNNTDNYVHTWDGELYLEYHRGTYTSVGFIKKWNRKLELAYRDIEILHTIGSLKKENWIYPADKIYSGWEIILRNQFHDIIPGSSIKEVYADYKIECQEAKNIVTELKENFTSQYLKPQENKWSIFNTSGWTTNELIFIPITESGYFIDEAAQVLPSAQNIDGYKVEVLNIEPLSTKVITFIPSNRESHASNSVASNEKGHTPNSSASNEKGYSPNSPPSNEKGHTPNSPASNETEFSVAEKSSPDPSFQFTKNSIETPYHKITWSEKGHITSLYDRQNKRQVIKEGGLGNYLRLFEDKPLNFDAWDIDLFHVLKSKTLEASKIKLLSLSLLSAHIEFTYEFGKSSLTQEMILYRHTPRIDFKTKVNWQERQQLLRTSFDANIRSTFATYDIQFGNVKRPTHWNTSWDMARFECVAHQWVDFSERTYGVALLNDSKYGHSVKDNTLSLSLLKGAIYPDPEADRGEHEFTYSLLPHTGDFIEGKVVEEAASLNNPMMPFKGNAGENTLIKIDSTTPLAIDAIKQKEDGKGIILRLHDHTGDTRKINLEPQFPFKYWQETTLMEKEIGTPSPNKDGKIHFELNPYEIKTLLIY